MRRRVFTALSAALCLLMISVSFAAAERCGEACVSVRAAVVPSIRVTATGKLISNTAVEVHRTASTVTFIPL